LPKNVGVVARTLTAIDFTMKFGPLPREIIAPKNTEPRLTATMNRGHDHRAPGKK
jgi:hypothetical protein